MSKYIRTPILHFDELPEEAQQAHMSDHIDTVIDGAEDSDDEFSRQEDIDERFVQDPCSPNEYLPLGMFEKFNGAWGIPNKLWDGHYGQTYFSAYFIKIGRTGEEAVVAYRHW